MCVREHNMQTNNIDYNTVLDGANKPACEQSAANNRPSSLNYYFILCITQIIAATLKSFIIFIVVFE